MQTKQGLCPRRLTSGCIQYGKGGTVGQVTSWRTRIRKWSLKKTALRWREAEYKKRIHQLREDEQKLSKRYDGSKEKAHQLGKHCWSQPSYETVVQLEDEQRETWPWRSRVQPQRRKICCSRDKTSQTKSRRCKGGVASCCNSKGSCVYCSNCSQNPTNQWVALFFGGITTQNQAPPCGSTTALPDNLTH